MIAPSGGWLAQVLATDAPVLPSAAAMQVGLHLGWGVVLAWLGASLVRRCWPGKPAPVAMQRGVALLLALWSLVPGPFAPAYWLGLAFQAPSLSAVLLCALLLRDVLPGTDPASRAASAVAAGRERVALPLAVLGTMLGWVLLLDSFARWPVSLYTWGFSPVALLPVALLALLPWLLAKRGSPPDRRAWVAPGAVVLFVALRLPSGNLWDALLDPWLWLALQAYVVRRVWRRYKKES